MQSYLMNIPKAELHIHIEGSLEPDLMFKIAKKNGVSIPFDSPDAIRKAYEFDDLQSFLDIYYQGVKVLIHEEDFYEMTMAYLNRAFDQNVRHTEIFFDPQAHTDRGISFETVICGIHRALQEARQVFGISSKLIMCFLRNLSVQSAMETLDRSLPYKDWIVAVGLDSSELGYPPERFAPVFTRARQQGFLTVAHAGEEGPPEYIWQALDHLKVSRIDHGVRCIEDSRLTAKLAEAQIPLTVCPLSNVKLKVFKDMSQHNLKELLDLGLCVTVNSDDPAYFGGYIAENLLALREHLGLGDQDIFRLAKNSFQGSFINRREKDAFMRELNEFAPLVNA